MRINSGSYILLHTLGFALVGSATPCLYAQEFPSKPIRFIVGFPPGGGADIVARQITPKLSELLGQPVIVDNRGGAGGVIATEIAAKSRPDGYSLLVVSSSHTVNPSLYKELPYDTMRDFVPVTLLVAAPSLMVVHPTLPAKSVQDLVALAKSKRGALVFASAGNGTAAHLAGELFKSLTGIQLTHVPFKGIAPALTAVLSGESHLTFASLPSALPQTKAGKLRALAVTSAKRSGFTPDTPTISEAGVGGYETTTWYGVLAPAKTPRAAIAKFAGSLTKTLAQPEIKSGLTGLSFDIVNNTPEEFGGFIKKETEKWSKVVVSSGMRVD